MSRHSLLRGVSAGALTVLALSELCVTPAAAQQSLPTIDVGGQRRGVVRRGAERVAGPARHECRAGSEPARAFAAVGLGGDASRRQARLRSEVAIAQHGRERHAPADRAHNQHRRHGRRGQIHAEPFRAQTQQRRHSGGFADPHLGRRLLGAQSRLCRRSAADGAHRQRQYDRRAALGPRRAGGNRARRFPLRTFRGAIPRQLDGRRVEDHDAHARKARSLGQEHHDDPGFLPVGNIERLRQ